MLRFAVRAAAWKIVCVVGWPSLDGIEGCMFSGMVSRKNAHRAAGYRRGSVGGSALDIFTT